MGHLLLNGSGEALKELPKTHGKLLQRHTPSFLLLFCVLWGGEGYTFFSEDKWLGDRLICSRFPRVYHLSSMKNLLVTAVLSRSGISPSPLLGSQRPLSIRKLWMLLIFFLYWASSAASGGGRIFICFWWPHPSDGFTCNSFLLCLVNPSSLSDSVFVSLWKVKISNKVKFFFFFFLVCVCVC